MFFSVRRRGLLVHQTRAGGSKERSRVNGNGKGSFYDSRQDSNGTTGCFIYYLLLLFIVCEGRPGDGGGLFVLPSICVEVSSPCLP